MRVEKTPTTMHMVLSASFDAEGGVLKVENRAVPPLNYGVALAIALNKDEARQLADELRKYADG